MNRVYKASIAAVLLAGLTAGTWFTAQSVQSPEQRRKAVEPPSMSRIVASVEKGRLEDRIPLTCEAGFVTVRAVDLPGEARVVTRIPVREGEKVTPGTLVADVQGSPVIALAGSFPYYRDITAQSQGPDVDQLRTSLAELGYLTVQGGEAGSPAGGGLLHAVGALAKDLGYPSLSGAETIPPSLFLVVPKGGAVVVSIQGGPGLAQKPFATIGLGGRQWLCSGQDGGVPAGVEAGQTARLIPESPQGEPLRVAFGEVSAGDAAAQGAQGMNAGRDAAGTPPQGGGGGGAERASRVVVLPRGEGTAANRTRAEVVVAYGPSDSLVVPASALWMKDGRTQVTVVDGDPARGDSPTRDVRVTAGMAVAGKTVVVPEAGGRLAPGDSVVVAAGTRGDER